MDVEKSVCVAVCDGLHNIVAEGRVLIVIVLIPLPAQPALRIILAIIRITVLVLIVSPTQIDFSALGNSYGYVILLEIISKPKLKDVCFDPKHKSNKIETS